MSIDKNNENSLNLIPELATKLHKLTTNIKFNLIPDSIVEKFSKISENFSAITSPFYEWLQSIDIPSIFKDGEPIRQKYERYLQLMYQAKWFPYVGWNADISFFAEILNIFSQGEGISQRVVEKIDDTVTSYYSDKEIRLIKKDWQNLISDRVIKRIMFQAVNAYFRKEYAITSITLSVLWQLLIYEKKGMSEKGRKDNETKEIYHSLVDENNFSEPFKSYFDDFIMYECRNKNQVIPEVPGRNSNAHGWFSDYPKKKTALNAIFLTHFILNLK